MKATIETLKFPCEFKKKLKMKASLGNLSISYIDGHLIKNNKTTLIAYLYDDNDKIYLPTSNAIISFTKFTEILNSMNKFI